jgi:hypothetical protein
MSSRSLATARARRAGENTPMMSGNRPITSIGSQAAFVPNQNPNMRQTKPSPKNQNMNSINNEINNNGLPFTKLSVSDAVGLITLRLGSIEKWIIEKEHENELKGE